MRRQRPRLAEPAPGQPAVARRGDRHGGVDGHPARAAARRGGAGARHGRGGLLGSRLRHPGRTGAGVRAQPPDRSGAAARGAARLRDERPSARASARCPLRLLVPGWYGMASVKWLGAIEAVTEPFAGFQQSVAYRYQTASDDAGEPVGARACARADDPARHRRLLHAAPVRGRRPGDALGPRLVRERSGRARRGRRRRRVVRRGAAAGGRRVRLARLELRLDGGAGEHELACRATDATGATQPLEAPWNHQGMGNNVVQRIPVTVR